MKTLFKINQDKPFESMGELPRGATGLAWSSYHDKVMFTESGTGLVMEQGESEDELIQVTYKEGPCPRGICFAPNGNHFFLEQENDSNIRVVRMGDFFEHSMIRNSSISTPSDSKSLRTNGICYAGITRGIFISSEKTNQILLLTNRDNKRPVIGSGEKGFSSGNKGEACNLDSPAGVSYSIPRKRLYVADTGNKVIREFSLKKGDFVPERLCGFPGEEGVQDGDSTSARFFAPTDLVLAPQELFIADGHTIRKLDLNSFKVSTVYTSEGRINSLAYSPEGCLYFIQEN